MDYEVQRFPWFDTCGAKGSIRETIWKYKRAIEGHKFLLVDFESNVDIATSRMVDVEPLRTQIYNGKVYSHWGSFPGIYDQSTLRLHVLQANGVNATSSLHNWECKEFTMSARNGNPYTVQFAIIVYFYEIPMSKLETFEYAVKQPRYKYRHGGPRTLDRFED
ncbi:hypothetical protein ES705_40110 [subsurface metagenome]